MENTEHELIDEQIRLDGYTDTINWGDLVKELTGSPFEKVYKDYLIHGADYDKESYLE